MPEPTTVLIAAMGVATGALITHWFHRRKRSRRHPSSLLSRQVATPYGSWVEDIEPFTHTPVRPYISPDQFRSQLREYTEKTRELMLTPGDPGAKLVTKVSGVPWWPSGKVRPMCAKGHAMSFIAQVLLAEVRALNEYSDKLLSFHYCDECSKEGKMSFGWGGPNPEGYDITIHETTTETQMDGLGLSTEPMDRA